MKNIILIIFVLCFCQIAKADNFGKRINVYSDTNGPQFGVQYAYDEDKFLALTVSFWGGDLLPNFSMKTLSWRLFDSSSGKFINEWTTAVNNSSPVMYPGTMVYSWTLSEEQEITEAIKSLSKLKLILSVDQDLASPVFTHYLDLGSYCVSNGNHFLNLTTGKQGCRVD